MKGKKIIGGVALGLLGLGVVGGSLYGSVEAIKDYKQTEALKQNGVVRKDKLSVSNISNLSTGIFTKPTYTQVQTYHCWRYPTDINDTAHLSAGDVLYVEKRKIETSDFDDLKYIEIEGINLSFNDEVEEIMNSSQYYQDLDIVILVLEDFSITPEEGYDFCFIQLYVGSENSEVNANYSDILQELIGAVITPDQVTELGDGGDENDSKVLYPGSYYMCNSEEWNDLRTTEVTLVARDTMISSSADPDLQRNGEVAIFTPDREVTVGDLCFDLGGSLNVPIFRVNPISEDLQAPTIDGTNNIVVNVNNMDSIETILSHVSAYDETDGKVDVKYEAEGTTYNPADKKVGEFIIKAYAEDSSGNRTNVDITVIVADIDKPTISGTNSYTVSYDAPKTLEEIKSVLKTSDNYDSGLALELVEDNYTGHERELGSHTIKFKTTDSSGNESEIFTVTITVEDKKAPVIGGAENITVANNAPIDLETFKSKFSANDDLEGSVEITINGFDAYLANQGKVGTYKITLTAKDSSGNTVTKEVNLIVEDKIAPEIVLDNYFIVLNEGEELTSEQIKEMASKVLGISAESIVEVSGEYDTNVAGAYKLSVKTITGETYSINLEVNANYEDTAQYRDLEWYEYLYVWFSIFFNFQEGYTTDSFWDFSTRCAYISEVYSSGKIKNTSESTDNVEETPVEEVSYRKEEQIGDYTIKF